MLLLSEMSRPAAASSLRLQARHVRHGLRPYLPFMVSMGRNRPAGRQIHLAGRSIILPARDREGEFHSRLRCKKERPCFMTISVD